MSKETTIERRVMPIEFRASGDGEKGRTVEGYAALFNSRTNLGWFEEEIAPGAFDSADMDDVVALFNHDPNYPLARTTSGTLKLEVDEKGLKYSFTAPETTFGEDLLKMLERGDISQSSFAFTIDAETWTEQKGQTPRRRIDRIGVLYDVSPVTYPAYKDTTVSARAKTEYEKQVSPDQQGRTDKNYPRLLAAIFSLTK